MTGYLDHAATSPLRPEAFAAMAPYLTEHFGNPSGIHAVARRARQAVEDARDSVSSHLGCRPDELVFTSGGTEACNMAVLGAHAAAGGRVLCSAIEHPAVLDACRSVGGTEVMVDDQGTLDLEALGALLGPDVGLVSVMVANNEVGTLQPLQEVARLVRELAPAAVLHTDAVAAGAGMDLAEVAASVDLVSVGAHKFGGPKGVGALVIRAGTKVARTRFGGSQERDRRAGTHNVAGIVGMAAALDTAVTRRPEEAAKVAALRDDLASGLISRAPGTTQTASGRPRLPGVCHLRFEGVEQEELLLLLDEAGVCASGGSACASGALEPSHVLVAMGQSPAQARQSVRFSLGWSTTAADVEMALEVVPKALQRLGGG